MSLYATVSRRAALGAALAVVLAASVPASTLALPTVGASRPPVHLQDGWDRELDLGRFDRPVLLIYEDKDSAFENQRLKDDSIELDKSVDYRKTIAHISVADVSAYDYWPAKGIAKGELRKWSEKLGIVVYGDFSGDIRTKLTLDKGESNVVLYAKNGDVLFASSGALTAKQRAALIDLVRGLCTPA